MNLPHIATDVDMTPIGLCRLSSAANLAKLSVELFEAGIEQGAIPLEIIAIGRRPFKYVRSIDLCRWLSGKTAR